MQTNQTTRQQFVELVETHQGILHRICSVYGRSIEDRQDLFQEMVMQLWRSYASFRGRSSFTTWMYKVALNTALFERRRAARRPDLTHGYEAELYSMVMETPPPRAGRRAAAGMHPGTAVPGSRHCPAPPR